MGFRLVSDSNRFVVWNVKQCCWWLIIHKRPTLIPHFSCLHTLSIALELAPLKINQQVKKKKKPWCFLPWLAASSWRNKSLGWGMKAFSAFIPGCTEEESWPAIGTGGLRGDPAHCALQRELCAAACEGRLEQSQVTGCWHCFLVATVKNHLIYMLCHACTASSLGPRQDSGRKSQVMSLGLAHPWQMFKLSACLGVDDIHL